jgi:hypothetical protein
MFVHSVGPQAWLDEDVALARNVAERTWGAVVHVLPIPGTLQRPRPGKVRAGRHPDGRGACGQGESFGYAFDPVAVVDYMEENGIKRSLFVARSETCQFLAAGILPLSRQPIC